MTKPSILLIDDSEDIHLLVKKTISDICGITSAYDYEGAKKQFENNVFAIVIIDLNLAESNGMDLFKEFKSHPTQTRFFIMTGKDDLNDELLGHTYGVHEYIKKPVNRDILKVIVKKNLKLFNQEATGEISVPPFHVYPEIFKASMLNDFGEEEELHLTVKEFKILTKLLSHPNQPFSREDLFAQIWESESESTFRTIDMHVSSLRKKLGDNGRYIKTVHQVGYKFLLA